MNASRRARRRGDDGDGTGPPAARARRIAAGGALVIILALIATGLATWMAHSSARDEGDRAAREAAISAAGFLRSTLTAADTTLTGWGGLMASDPVTEEQFSVYARTVLGPSGLTGIGWVRPVRADERAAFEARTGVRVVEARPGSRRWRPARARSLHWVAMLSASIDGPLLPAGADVGAEPTRAAALARTVRSARPEVVGPVPLLTSGSSGLVIYRPVYGAASPATPAARARAVAGVAFGGFRLDEMLAPVLRAAALPVAIRVRGAEFASRPGVPSAGGSEEHVDFGGVRFEVAAAAPATDLRLAGVILGGGLALAGVMSMLLMTALRRDRRLRRAVEEATRDLRASRASHRALVENSPDVISRYDRSLRCVYISPGIEAGTGRPPEDWLGLRPSEMGMPPELADAWTAALGAVLRDGVGGEFEFVHATGPGPDAHYQVRLQPEWGPDGTVSSVLTSTRDVSELRMTAEELRRSRDYAAAVVDSLHDGLIVLDAEGRLASVNQRLCTMTGFTREELIGTRPPFPFHMADEGSGIRAVVDRCLLLGDTGEFEVTYRHRDGTPVPVRIGAAPLRDSDGAVLGGVRLVRDITAEREAQEALRASDERHRGLIRVMADGMVVHAGGGAIIECNPAAERILGAARAELVGSEGHAFHRQALREDGTPLPPGEHPSMVALGTGRPVHGVVVGFARADGGTAWLRVSAEPLTLRGGAVVVTTFSDITARLEAEHEQAVLHRLATLVAGQAPAQEVFDAIARAAGEGLDAAGTAVIRFSPDRAAGVLVGAWTAAEGARAPRGQDEPLKEGTATAAVAATGRPARLGGAGPPSPDEPGMSRMGAWASVATPVSVNGRLWGALTVATTDRRPIPADAERRLGHLADVASLAIMSAEAREQLSHLATTDDLTGIPNRRAFQDRLAAATADARRRGVPLSLVVMDIDHFKRVNDTHGHPAGDRVLVEFALRLGGLVRADEVVARVGGEEFAWIIPGAGADDAVRAAERLRAVIGDESFRGVGRLTVSAGVCELADASDRDLFRAADTALYRAKEQGRNRVVRHRPAVPPVPEAVPGAGAGTTMTP